MSTFSYRKVCLVKHTPDTWYTDTSEYLKKKGKIGIVISRFCCTVSYILERYGLVAPVIHVSTENLLRLDVRVHIARLSLCQTLLHSYKSLLKVYKSHARHLSWLIGATRPTLRPLAARMPCVFVLHGHNFHCFCSTFVICLARSKLSLDSPLEEVIRSSCVSLVQEQSKQGFNNLRRDTIGSPALGQGSNCKLFVVSEAPNLYKA